MRVDEQALSGEQELSDELLMGRGSAGVAMLYDRHGRAVFRLAVGVLSDADEADDVVQETFLLAWRKRRSVTLVGGSALPWLLTVARLEALSARRRRQRRAARQVLFDPALHDRSVTDDVDPVETVLAGLTAHDRAVVQAVLVDGLSYAEAAERLGLTVTTVGKRLQRARSRLKARLRAETQLPDSPVNTTHVNKTHMNGAQMNEEGAC
ncbi:RNA polymerase sigma factor [uncultured Amnibacterium sp.]|uniref:RNA polymerase sigma factor n=1 Tax=uncultured Amnibacterium sp. TaxID=1631851 RepID=UPI0035CC9396